MAGFSRTGQNILNAEARRGVAESAERRNVRDGEFPNEMTSETIGAAMRVPFDLPLLRDTSAHSALKVF